MGFLKMLARKPQPLDIDYQAVNNGGLFEYDPFYMRDSVVVIDESWWASLPDFAKEKIQAQYSDFVLEKVPVPHV